jgi:transposase
MFFREKKSRKSKNATLQLVENYRDDDKVKQRIVISLGVGFKIASNQRQLVAATIEQKLSQQTELFDSNDPTVKQLAERVVKMIQTKGYWPIDPKNNHNQRENQAGEHVAEVYIDKVEHGNSRILGPLLIGHTFWKRLGFNEILAQCGFNGVETNIAQLSVLSRLIDQNSEHAIPSWLKTVAAEELIDAWAENYSENRFYNISDLLLKNKDFIEQHLYEREKSLFNLTNTIFLYDLTNTYFEGLCNSNPKAKFCNNQKEKRTDCRQIVIALFLDSDGFIRRYRIFDGKMSDAKSLRHILKELKYDFPADAIPTIIMDRGVVSDENIELIKSAGFHYIATSRPNEEQDFVEDFKTADFKTIKNSQDNQVEIYLKKQNDASYLLCKSELKQAKEQSMRNQREQRLDSDLENLGKSITTGKRIDPLAIERSIGRLKEKHSAVAKYYCIEFKPFSFKYQLCEAEALPKRLLKSLEKLQHKAEQYKISHVTLQSKLEALSQKYRDEYHKIIIDIQQPYFSGKPIDEKRAESEDLDGNYLIKTDRTDLADAEIWKLYTMLTLVENAFRNLKTDLKLRPNFHQKEHRVDGHVFITILAYHLLHSIEHTLRENDCTSSWATVKRVVSSHVYTSITLPTTSGSVIHLRKPGTPELIHEDIYKKLKVNWEQLPSTKFEMKEKVR